MEQNSPTGLFELHIDAPSSAYLTETAKWAKFFSILGFIFCGLILCLALFAGSILSVMLNRYGGEEAALSGVGSAFIAFWYILVAVIYFFPCLYLFRFANKMLVALRTNDQEQLANSLKNLKAHYRFIGILTIISLSLFALGLLFTIIGAAAGGGR